MLRSRVVDIKDYQGWCIECDLILILDMLEEFQFDEDLKQIECEVEVE